MTASALRHPTPAVSDVLRRKLLFVSGKGGVGKTVVSQAIARALAERGKNTLWITFEDPMMEAGATRDLAPNLKHLNADASTAFEEYATSKIGGGPLARLFLQNKVVRYLAKAAPGIHELVLLGKVWDEHRSHDVIVADMPSTGHGLAMFQSTKNFTTLFSGGPIHRDAATMLQTFSDPALCGQLIVALPEEMPLREALELNDFLVDLFPDNSPAFLVNRVFPRGPRGPHGPDGRPHGESASPSAWRTPLASSAADYVQKRIALEYFNLRLWREAELPFSELEFALPASDSTADTMASLVARQILAKGLV